MGHRFGEFLEDLDTLVALNHILKQTEGVESLRKTFYCVSHVATLRVDVLTACDQLCKQDLVGFNESLHPPAEGLSLFVVLHSDAAALSHERGQVSPGVLLFFFLLCVSVPAIRVGHVQEVQEYGTLLKLF